MNSDNMLQHNESVRRYFEAWNTGRLEIFDELLAADYVNHTPSLPGRPGKEGLKYIAAAIRSGFPDIHYEIIHIVAQDDLVAVHTRVTGTNTGELFGSAPTGKRIEVDQMQFERFKDGKIVEHWRITDEKLMQDQLAK